MVSATGSTIPGGSTLADLQIAGAEFDAARNLLWKGTETRHLAPREAAVLARLLEAPRETVSTRMQLLDSVWCDDEVGDEALTVIISRLRRHFRLLGVEHPVIETIPKIGYRLVTEPKIERGLESDLRIPNKVESIARLALSVAIIALGIALTDLLLQLL
ncbi:MAG: winged helix-turn-helix domain-containing protein [Candidatus Wenzhouxiangella sp. M2_3B_020]